MGETQKNPSCARTCTSQNSLLIVISLGRALSSVLFPITDSDKKKFSISLFLPRSFFSLPRSKEAPPLSGPVRTQLIFPNRGTDGRQKKYARFSFGSQRKRWREEVLREIGTLRFNGEKNKKNAATHPPMRRYYVRPINILLLVLRPQLRNKTFIREVGSRRRRPSRSSRRFKRRPPLFRRSHRVFRLPPGRDLAGKFANFYTSFNAERCQKDIFV